MKVTLIVLACLAIQLGIALLLGRFLRAGRERRCTVAKGQPQWSGNWSESPDLPLPAISDNEQFLAARGHAALNGGIEPESSSSASDSIYAPPRQARTA